MSWSKQRPIIFSYFIYDRIIIERLRNHINGEDEILYTITLQEFTPKELEELFESVN